MSSDTSRKKTRPETASAVDIQTPTDDRGPLDERRAGRAYTDPANQALFQWGSGGWGEDP